MIDALIAREWRQTGPKSRLRMFRRMFMLVLLAESAFLIWAFIRALFDLVPETRQTMAFFWGPTSARWHADFGLFLIAQAFLFVAALAPGLAGTAFLHEQQQRTLDLLFTTHLTSWEIVLGKAWGTASLLFFVVSPCLPLIAFFCALLAIPGHVLLITLFEAVTLIAVLTSLGIVAAIEMRSPILATLVAYGFLVLAVGAAALAGISPFDLLVVTRYYCNAPLAIVEQLSILLLAVLVAGGSLAWGAWRLRSIWAHQNEAKTREYAPPSRPEVSDSPLHWKERYLTDLGLLSAIRFLPSWLRPPLVGLVVAAIWFTASWTDTFWPILVVFPFIVSLLAVIQGSGMIVGEKARDSWDTLCLTPLTSMQIVRGKVWGVHDTFGPIMLSVLIGGYLGIGLGSDLFDFAVRASCFSWVWLFCWPLLYFSTALGVRQSALATGPWDALIFSIGRMVIEFGGSLLVTLYIAGYGGFLGLTIVLVLIDIPLRAYGVGGIGGVGPSTTLVYVGLSFVVPALLSVYWLPRGDQFVETAEEAVDDLLAPWKKRIAKRRAAAKAKRKRELAERDLDISRK